MHIASMMTTNKSFANRLCFRPEDGTGALAASDPTPAGDPTPTSSWWQGLTDEAQGFVKAKGLDAVDPGEALPRVLEMARNAERKLGKPADTLIQRPAEGQDVSEWLAAQREVFGLPQDVKGYEVKPPKDFPKDAWNTELAEQAASLAHSMAVPKSVHERYVGLFADYVQKLDQQTSEQYETARTAMMSELERGWGDETESRTTRAAQAAQHLAEAAGLDADAISAMSATLAAKVGDANVLRIFDAVAQAMAEDTAVDIGKGGAGFTSTREDAKARLAELRAPGGAYYQAVETKNHTEIKRLSGEIERLTAIVVDQPSR